jgi:hypothetical protein
MNDKPIMLIEDNPDDRDLTIRGLKKHNILNHGGGALSTGTEQVRREPRAF